MPRAETQPVRIAGDLLGKLKADAQANGRSLPSETEARLRESLARGAWSEVERKLDRRALAIGRLIGFLVNELGEFSASKDRDAFIKAGVTRMLDRIASETKLPPPEHDAEMLADYWWLTLTNARERSYHDGKAQPLTADQRAFAELQETLIPAAATKSEPTARPRKERK